MISDPLLQLVEICAADGRITPDEVARLRASVFRDGVVTRAEAEALFALNDRLGDDEFAWRQAFVTAIADHLIDGGSPRGHITREGASWLEAQITADGRVKPRTELELVLTALERAESAPEELASFARTLVSRAVLSKDACTSDDPERIPGQIRAAEAALIRRALQAGAASGGIWVTRAEAEWLFTLDEATIGHAHDPAWQDVFVKGLLNHLFAPAPDRLLDREEVIRRAVWLEQSPAPTPLGFWARAFAGGLRDYNGRLREADPAAMIADHYEARRHASIAAERFDLAEATYICARVRADGRRSPNEEALLAAIEEAKAAA